MRQTRLAEIYLFAGLYKKAVSCNNWQALAVGC